MVKNERGIAFFLLNNVNYTIDGLVKSSSLIKRWPGGNFDIPGAGVGQSFSHIYAILKICPAPAIQ